MDVYGWMVLAALIFLASLISVELGLSAAIIEITLGAVGGNFLGVERHEWVRYLAAFGGILLTFMAGAEVDLGVMKEKARESFLIGGLSFLAPFVGIVFLCRYLLDWSWPSSQLAAIALSTTSLAVVYAVLVETGLTRSDKIGLGDRHNVTHHDETNLESTADCFRPIALWALQENLGRLLINEDQVFHAYLRAVDGNCYHCCPRRERCLTLIVDPARSEPSLSESPLSIPSLP